MLYPLRSCFYIVCQRPGVSSQIKDCACKIYGPLREKPFFGVLTNKGTDQPAHSRILISTFVIHLLASKISAFMLLAAKRETRPLRELWLVFENRVPLFWTSICLGAKCFKNMISSLFVYFSVKPEKQLVPFREISAVVELDFQAEFSNMLHVYVIVKNKGLTTQCVAFLNNWPAVSGSY